MVKKSRVSMSRPVYQALNDKISRLKALKKDPKMAKLVSRKPTKPRKRSKARPKTGKRSKQRPPSGKVRRALPYLKSLIAASSSHRPSLLKTYPKYVVNDMVHAINNISLGKYTSNKINGLRKYKSVLQKLLKSKNKKLIYKQKGGFLGMIASAVIPLIAGAIGRSIAR